MNIIKPGLTHWAFLHLAIELLLHIIKITQGSILDLNFLKSLGQVDYVCCWGVGSSHFWKKIKDFNSKRSKTYEKILFSFILCLYRLKEKFQKYKFEETETRGMTTELALKDWLFGSPYEYATVDEVFNFHIRHGFTLKKIKSNEGLRTNHYLFKKIIN